MGGERCPSGSPGTHAIPWPLAYSSFIAVMGLVGYGTYLLVRYLERRKIAKKVRERTNLVGQLWRTSTNIYGTPT